jgi:nicotinate-nucleotide adenylyltransferase
MTRCRRNASLQILYDGNGFLTMTQGMPPSSAASSPAPAALIGLYGGSFDPVHLGHVATAQALCEQLPFCEIRFLPAACSPLKAGSTADNHRLAMLRLALQGKQGLTIDSRELQRPPPSYTIDTLQEVRRELGPDVALAFIMGLDSFLELPRWKDWQQLTSLAHLIVVSRPGHVPAFSGPLEDWLKKHRIITAEPLESRPRGGVLFIETPPHAIASRDIRAAVQQNRDTSRWLNPAVRDYIEQHHLYSGDADPQ